MKNTLILIGLIILLGVISINLMAQEPKPDSTVVNTNKAIGANIFLGQGYYFGNISDYFTNPFLVGISLDIYRGNFVIQIDDYYGFGKTKQTLTFSDNKEWTKDENAYSWMLGCNVGYQLYNNQRIKFVPIAGVGFNDLSSLMFASNDLSKYQPTLPFYKLGFFADIKTSKLRRKTNDELPKRENHFGVRLSFGVNSPIGTSDYPEYYNGTTVYFSIGFRGLSRKYEQRQLR